ncbi:lymphocyte expansion molecule-like [Odontomachus brunneus]|uniref:lymphocyte expansion molecule-like n=1 Tax=Odontomachus brunneus TaxID=486640 RepID=UPI0013F257BC|nr:lymphocyte expansion molecule-like [Odontomachus brunneus]
MDNKLGLHPKMRNLISVSPGVGTYYPRSIDRKPEAISWERKEEMERFSAMMGGNLTKEITAQRELMRTGGGPGTYDMPRWPESISKTLCKSLVEDVDFGTVPRFEPSYKSTTPGPGYTLRVHNPYYYLEKKRLKGFSQVPPFEFDGLAPRFRETRKIWSLPCNRYNVKHPHSLEVFLKSVTGKRGPYDIFTGPRDETTLKGMPWARKKLPDSGDWPRKLPSEMEKLLDKSNYFKGKWTINPRFPKKPVIRMLLQDISTCYKDPDEPGPGHYDPRIPQKPTTRKKYPFDSNVEFARPLLPSDIHPGPTRYKIEQVRVIKGHGWSSVFKSKVPRTITLIPPSFKNF